MPDTNIDDHRARMEQLERSQREANSGHGSGHQDQEEKKKTEASKK